MARLTLFGILLVACHALAQTCSNQAIGPGTYFIASALGDDRCVIVDPDKPSATFYYCKGTPARLKQFTFATDPHHGSCYRLQSASTGGYLTPTINDLPGDALLVISAQGNNASMYWQVIKNSDHTYTFVAEGIASKPCMNRRSDDDKGRVQAIHCTGVTNLERFWLPSTKTELEKLSKKKGKGK